MNLVRMKNAEQFDRKNFDQFWEFFCPSCGEKISVEILANPIEEKKVMK